MKSKPIDLSCPVMMVTYGEFVRVFRRFEPNDRYFHIGHKKARKWIALWDWTAGVWLMNSTVNLLLEAVFGDQRTAKAFFNG